MRFTGEEKVSISVRGMSTEDVPMWTINHFFKSYCDNYVKLVLLTRLCILYQNGTTDDEILISAKSIPVISEKAYIDKFLYANRDIVEYAQKGENPRTFWEIFNRCERPMIYYRERGNVLTPLYNYYGEEAIKIREMSYNSPVRYLADGLGAAIDLAEARSRNKREEEEHVARQVANLADGWASISRASQVINDDRTPPGVKAYAQAALDKLMHQQAKLNEKLDIRVERIDARI